MGQHFEHLEVRINLCRFAEQGDTIFGAIEGSRRSMNSSDKRVLANFCDKNAVFTNFCDKMPYLQIFATKMTFLNYMTKTQCLALILSVQDRINQSIANLFDSQPALSIANLLYR